MIQRVLFYGLFLAAVAVLPYVSSEWLKASRPTAAAESSTGDGAADRLSLAPSSAMAAGAAHSAPPAVAQSPAAPPIVSLSEAIRFDATAPWILQRWPRVVTGLPDGELLGYRVPLVTGTREDDVAGSLTYYFSPQHVCRKITFQGTVGDPRKVVAYSAGRFGLIQRTASEPGLQLYQTRWNGKPVSELRIKPAAVVTAESPHARYGVELTLNSWARR